MQLRCAETTKTALKLQAAPEEHVPENSDTVMQSAYRTAHNVSRNYGRFYQPTC